MHLQTLNALNQSNVCTFVHNSHRVSVACPIKMPTMLLLFNMQQRHTQHNARVEVQPLRKRKHRMERRSTHTQTTHGAHPQFASLFTHQTRTATAHNNKRLPFATHKHASAVCVLIWQQNSSRRRRRCRRCWRCGAPFEAQYNNSETHTHTQTKAHIHMNNVPADTINIRFGGRKYDRSRLRDGRGLRLKSIIMSYSCVCTFFPPFYIARRVCVCFVLVERHHKQNERHSITAYIHSAGSEGIYFDCEYRGARCHTNCCSRCVLCVLCTLCVCKLMRGW